jgi:hypothetical protein
MGSYPFFNPQHGANTNVVLRARDAQKLAVPKRAVEDMLERVRRAQSNSVLALPGGEPKPTPPRQVDVCPIASIQ